MLVPCPLQQGLIQIQTLILKLWCGSMDPCRDPVASLLVPSRAGVWALRAAGRRARLPGGEPELIKTRTGQLCLLLSPANSAQSLKSIWLAQTWAGPCTGL